MAKKLLIVHGYSDGRTSFNALGDFVMAQRLSMPATMSSI